MEVANLFPETEEILDIDVTELDTLASQTAVFGRSWRFDFAKGEFVLTPTGKVAMTDEKDAWVMWCEKAVRTPRYRHVIYSRDYGSELEDLLGNSYSRAVVESEVRRMVSETLLADARTAGVDQFEFSWEQDACSFSCRIRNVRDEMETIESVVI